MKTDRLVVLALAALQSLIPGSAAAEHPLDEEEGFNAEVWLRRYGYLSPSSSSMSTLQSSHLLSNAVRDMQRFYGLEETGRTDAATLTAMRRPRCGLPDRRGEYGVRRKRYAENNKWNKNIITYSLQRGLLPESLGEEATLSALRRAFSVWSEVTPLTFRELPVANGSGAELADILVMFASGYHGDASLFDGEGGSLAHAFYPGPGVGGDTHFDADEPWTLDDHDPQGVDLFLVAVHELGHALGLQHSENTHAVMAPIYRHVHTHDFTLHRHDVTAIQHVYGAPPTVSEAPPTPPDHPDVDSSPSTTSPPPEAPPTSPSPPEAPPTSTSPPEPPPETPRPTSPPALPTSTPTRPEPVTPPVRNPAPAPPAPPPAPPPKQPDSQRPEICDGDFDTVTVLRGEMFVFKGSWFWRVRRNRVLENYPMPISVFWHGLPSHIDAAYERHDGKFVFFKGERFWVFREADVLPGYPQPLREYGQGMPSHHIDTAVWWEPNGFTYFFSGDRYWRYNEETRTTDRDSPKPLSRWGRIPDSPKGAFLSDDGAHTYFYKGSSYWRFDNVKTEPEFGFPRSILRDFMGCPGDPDPDLDLDLDQDPDLDPDQDQDLDPRPDPDPKPDPRPDPTVKPSDGGEVENKKPDSGDGDEDEDEDDEEEVNVVVTVTDSESKVMTLIMVIVPLVLILCILVLVYAILRTLHNKEAPRALVHCKRSLQDWV